LFPKVRIGLPFTKALNTAWTFQMAVRCSAKARQHLLSAIRQSDDGNESKWHHQPDFYRIKSDQYVGLEYICICQRESVEIHGQARPPVHLFRLYGWGNLYAAPLAYHSGAVYPTLVVSEPNKRERPGECLQHRFLRRILCRLFNERFSGGLVFRTRSWSLRPKYVR
jgi:hypothetical protein